MDALLERYERQATLLDQPELDELPALAEILCLAEAERRGWKDRGRKVYLGGRPVGGVGTGSFYVESLPPHPVADFSTITLNTTSLMLWPASVWTSTGGGQYWWPGKKVRLDVFGKIVTAATPGNLTVECRYGTTDNGGTLLATSAAQTLVINQSTAVTWKVVLDIECRAVGTGTNGSFMVTGDAYFGTAVIAVGDFLIPATAPAATGVDTSTASGLNLQFKRSGSTAETATVVKLVMFHLN